MLRSLRTGLAATVYLLVCMIGSDAYATTAANLADPNHSQIASSIPLTQLAVAGFEEPLIAMELPSVEETQALKQALAVYFQQKDASQVDALNAFLTAYPQSTWRVGLQTNLGLIHYHNGAFSAAIDAWEDAWKLGATATGMQQKALVDRAYGELVRMHARLGHADRLAALIEQSKHRILIGSATEALIGAKEGLWEMRNEPGIAYLCGPSALRSILSLQNPKDQKGIAALLEARSGKHGFNLNQVNQLAEKIGMPYQMAYREGNAPLPLPVVVHWKVHHYAAVVGEDNGIYHIKDPTFGTDLWVPKAVLEKEASGYYLIPKDKFSKGWREVASAEADQVYGMGYTGTNDPNRTSPDDNKNSNNTCNCSSGMARYDVHSMVVSLNIKDTPVGYRPPKGPSVYTTLTYNQREANQPANMMYSNLGRKWTFNWLSYIQDSPSSPGASVMRYVSGGGAYPYTGYNAGNGNFAAEAKQGAVLVRTSSSPITYERRLNDGSKEIYSQSNGSTVYPRRVFLSQIVDHNGNAVTLNYDPLQRLTSVVDALGQQTIFVYQNTQSPYLISQIIDPFGRTAQMDYDTNGRLMQITDAVGMVSKFAYDGGTFLNAMTTPYGTTSFTYGESGTTRWLTATDPNGETERTEYRHSGPGIPFSESIVPAGINSFNAYIDERNTFFWDKRAYKLYPNDYTKAEIKHWLHDATGSATAGVLESVKRPLERRVWFNYPNQPWAGGVGGQELASVIARVLDDGSTQLTSKSYNSLGKLTDRIDPVGRETVYTYDTNQIDLLTVKQKNGTGFDTLATYTYNSQHLPLTYKNAAGQTTTFTYNANGQLTQVVNAKGEMTTYQYDTNGYLLSVVNANNVIQQSYTYDTVGRIATQTDSEGYTLAYGYDNLDRLTAITYPDGTHNLYAWDKLDVVTETDRSGRAKTYSYDSVRRLTSVTDPLQRQLNFGYFENGQLKTLTDANSHTTTWDRDIESRVTVKTDANGISTKYAYENTTSRLHSVTDGLNQAKQYGYAKGNNLVSVSYINAVNPTPNMNFAYDTAYPRITSMTDGNGVTNYQYYAAGVLGANHLKAEAGPYLNNTVQYVYDPLGRVVATTVDTTTETFGFDVVNRMNTHQDALGTFAYSYLGQTTQLSNFSNGVNSANYTYEANLADRRLKGIANPVVTFNYTTNVENLITSIGQPSLASSDGHGKAADDHGNGKDAQHGQDAASHGKAAEVHGKGHDGEHGKDGDVQTATVATINYGYDDANRLTTVTGGSNVTQYGYDAGDNLQSILTNGLSTTSAQYDAANQITAANATSFTYDANGNLLDDGARHYAWDAENRLIKIASNTVAGQFTTMRYDGQSRRVAIIDQSGSTAVEKRYTWCGNRICQERDGQDLVTKHYYAEGETHGATVLNYMRNHLGSVVNVTDATGIVLATNTYDAYGKTTSTGTTNADFGYAGMFYHAASGLYLTQYRAYDSSTTRWLSRDPIAEAGGINLYGYVSGNPVRYTDPLGLGPWDKLYGFPKEFWKWLHQEEGGKLIKELKDETGQVPKDVAEPYYKDWKDSQGGYFDPSIIPELFIPFLWTPQSLGCGTMDCAKEKDQPVEPNPCP
jgi:RHS repeat-associated protein